MENNQTTNLTAGLIAAFALIVILVLLGLYFYGANVANDNRVIEVPVSGPAINSIESGDELADIEAELTEFDVESLDNTDTEVDATISTE